jgi:hypothetical protein
MQGNTVLAKTIHDLPFLYMKIKLSISREISPSFAKCKHYVYSENNNENIMYAAKAKRCHIKHEDNLWLIS